MTLRPLTFAIPAVLLAGALFAAPTHAEQMTPASQTKMEEACRTDMAKTAKPTPTPEQTKLACSCLMAHVAKTDTSYTNEQWLAMANVIQNGGMKKGDPHPEVAMAAGFYLMGMEDPAVKSCIAKK